MRAAILDGGSRLFDAIERRWAAPPMRRAIASTLVVAFVVSLGLIELSRLGILTQIFGHPMPRNHFHAISWAVTLLLIVEVLDLVFGLGASMSRAMGKQLEILSLVLLRKTFDELPKFPEPIVVEGHLEALWRMGSQALGALLIFALLIGFYRITKQRPVPAGESELADFIAFKKLICLVLLTAFAVIGAIAGVQSLTLVSIDATLSLRFFVLFYTILVFTDVLVVLASLHSTLGYAMVFRNFGYAVVTVMIRLALAAEPHTNVILGVVAALFALAVGAVYRLASTVDRLDESPSGASSGSGQ